MAPTPPYPHLLTAYTIETQRPVPNSPGAELRQAAGSCPCGQSLEVQGYLLKARWIITGWPGLSCLEGCYSEHWLEGETRQAVWGQP